MQYLNPILQRKVVPLVTTFPLHRGAYYQSQETDYGSRRFITLASNNPTVFANENAFRFYDIFKRGTSRVRFYKQPPEGAIVRINELQYQIKGSIDDDTIISPPLFHDVSNQVFAHLIAVPLHLKDVNGVRTLRIYEDTPYTVYPHDVIQLGSQNLTVVGLRYPEGKTGIEIDVDSIINSQREDQTCYLMSSPAYKSMPVHINDHIGPFLMELPFSTHLDLDYSLYSKVYLNAIKDKSFFEQEVKSNEFVVVERPIFAGSMLLWDKIEDCRMDYNGKMLVLDTKNINRAGVRGQCWPYLPNRSVDHYVITIAPGAEIDFSLRLYPNDAETQHITAKGHYYFHGPAHYDKPIEAIEIKVESKRRTEVFISDFTPNRTAIYFMYQNLVINNSERPFDSYDFLMSAPQMKPQWPIIEEIYAWTDISHLDAGYVLGTSPEDVLLLERDKART